MKKTLAAAAALLLSTGFAFADDVMANRFGNTVVATNAKGEVTKIHYDADGSFKATGPAGEAKGTWAVADGQLCLTQTEPAPAAGTAPLCNPVAAHAVGDKWSMGEGDAKIDLELVAGR